MADLKTLTSEKRYSGQVFNLVVDSIEYPSGNRGIREIADHPGGAVAIPVFENGDVLLIHHFRYPVHQPLFELPAGKLDPGEDPRHCVTRELEEETGYLAGSIEKLSSFYTTPGFCNERLHLFLASDLKVSPWGRKLEEGELGMTLHRTPFPDAIRMIQTGEIVDAKTICGILLAERVLNRITAERPSGTPPSTKRLAGEPMTNDEQPDEYPKDRAYRLDLKQCLVRSCDGELAELSYYERNNWVTIECKCNTCGKEFTVKVEV